MQLISYKDTSMLQVFSAYKATVATTIQKHKGITYTSATSSLARAMCMQLHNQFLCLCYICAPLTQLQHPQPLQYLCLCYKVCCQLGKCSNTQAILRQSQLFYTIENQGRNKQIVRQIARQTDNQIDRCIDRQIDKQIKRYIKDR